MAGANTIVDSLYGENVALATFLDQSKELSLRNDAEKNFRKVLLLSAASYFETRIKEILIEYVAKDGAGELVVEFVKNRAIERQYHTFFDWKASNANAFLKMFGEKFSEFAKGCSKADPQLEQGISAFMEIGRLRNTLVHENFALFPLEKTPEEIYSLYKQALYFVQYLPILFEGYLGSDEKLPNF